MSSRSPELVGVGHRFGKVRVLAIMPCKMYPGKLDWTSNADQMKFNGWFIQNLGHAKGCVYGTFHSQRITSAQHHNLLDTARYHP